MQRPHMKPIIRLAEVSKYTVARPDDPRVFIILASLYASKICGCVCLFKEAVRLKPLLYCVGIAWKFLDSAGKLSEAVVAYQSAIGVEPNNDEAHRNWAQH
jgi:hypothetical protein